MFVLFIIIDANMMTIPGFTSTELAYEAFLKIKKDTGYLRLYHSIVEVK